MTTHTHVKHPSISSITPSINSAPPPSKAEVERKLSVKLTGVNIPRRPTKVRLFPHSQFSQQSKSQHVGSGNESDTSTNASTSLPPLITSSLGLCGGGHFTASPVATPSAPHNPHAHQLSAIAERQATSMEMDERNHHPPPDESPVVADEDESDEEGGAELERGMDGERIFKSGFLIKKQERRKVRAQRCTETDRRCGRRSGSSFARPRLHTTRTIA